VTPNPIHRMKTTHRLLPTLALLATAAVAVSPIHAAGLVHQRTGLLTLDYFNTESAAFDNGGGVTLLYNQPVTDRGDFSVGYSHLSYDSARVGGGDATKDRFMVYGAGIGELDTDTPYARVGFGWGRDKYGPTKLESALYSIRIGVEWKPEEKWAVNLYGDWTDSFNSEVDGTLVYGVLADHDLSETMSGVLQLEGDDHFNWKLSVGALFRF